MLVSCGLGTCRGCPAPAGSRAAAACSSSGPFSALFPARFILDDSALYLSDKCEVETLDLRRGGQALVGLPPFSEGARSPATPSAASAPLQLPPGLSAPTRVCVHMVAAPGQMDAGSPLWWGAQGWV